MNKIPVRSPRLLYLSSCVFALWICGLAPLLQAQATKDPAAVSAINTALTSMGGQPAFAAIQDAVITAQAQDADGQPTSPQFTWKSIGVSLRTETTSPDGNTITTAQGGAGYLEDSSGAVSSMDQRLANSIFPHHLPGVILLYLLNAPDRSLSVISDTGATQNLVHVQSVQILSDQTTVSETQQDWYIDMNTGLPTRVDYVIPGQSGSDATGTVQFTSWQKTATVLIPQVLQDVQGTILVGTPAFNQGLSTAILTLP
jgi:hypothetical protein